MVLEPWLRRRLEAEFKQAESKNSEERTIAPIDKTDFRVWRGYVRGQDGKTHSFEMRFTKVYPLEPPEIEWLTPILHPNIEPPKPEGLGRVCLAWLTDPREWSPDTSVNAVIEGILYVLNNPNPRDPLMHRSCLGEAIRIMEKTIDRSTLSNENLVKIRNLLASANQSVQQSVARSSYDETAYKLVKEAGFLLGTDKQRG